MKYLYLVYMHTIGVVSHVSFMYPLSCELCRRRDCWSFERHDAHTDAEYRNTHAYVCIWNVEKPKMPRDDHCARHSGRNLHKKVPFSYRGF